MFGISTLAIGVVLLLVIATQIFKILNEYERGVIFTFGRFTGVKYARSMAQGFLVTSSTVPTRRPCVSRAMMTRESVMRRSVPLSLAMRLQ